MRKPLWQIALLQALGIGFYIGFAAWFMWNAERWFGKMNDFTGPLLFLTFFSVSVLTCGLMVFGYPYLFWAGGKAKEALRIVVYTAGWLGGFALLLMASLLIF